jgi:energy-coupling factor transporter ATP-binding protein EcfA2
MFSSEKNKHLTVDKAVSNCDDELVKNLADPLPNKHFSLLIVGHSGSGKSSLLYSLLKKGKNSNGIYTGYAGVFENILVCSPSMSSFNDDIFADLDESKKHTVFDESFINFVDDFTEVNAELGFNTLVVLDDVGSSLRTNIRMEKAFSSILQKRRQKRLSTIILVQKYKDVQTAVRSNISHCAIFRSVNTLEEESITNELVHLPKDVIKRFYQFVYDARYTFLFIDLSLSVSPLFRYFKNFDLISFN